MVKFGYILNACGFLLFSFLGNDLTQLVGVVAAASLFTVAKNLN